jgi:hypothetical protein
MASSPWGDANDLLAPCVFQIETMTHKTMAQDLCVVSIKSGEVSLSVHVWAMPSPLIYTYVDSTLSITHFLSHKHTWIGAREDSDAAH